MADTKRITVPKDAVVMEPKSWKASKTVVINGLLFVGASLVQTIDLLFGMNVIEPVVRIWVHDPENATHIITVLTQVYTTVNVYLRVFQTRQPVTLSRK